MSGLIFHLIPHTHWDREWYLPRAAFQARLVPALDDLLERLQADSAYRSFLLDGQTVLVADYLSARPEREAELKTLVKTGRLQVGPWYVLADELIPSGEALVRNLLLGAADAEHLGGRLDVLYSPDAFGHPAVSPTLAREFGIRCGVVWRGLGGESGQERDLYRWRGPDGRDVLVWHLPPAGYEIGAALPAAADRLATAWAAIRPGLVERAAAKHIPVFIGADHHAAHPAVSRLRDLLAELEPRSAFRVSRLDEFFQLVGEGVQPAPLDGELRWSYRYAWTLQGVHATRAPLKRRATAAELCLERLAEPLAALARRAGGRDRRPVLELAWRTLVRCQFHDAIAGCTSDDVARAVDGRLTSVEGPCSTWCDTTRTRRGNAPATRHPPWCCGTRPRGRAAAWSSSMSRCLGAMFRWGRPPDARHAKARDTDRSGLRGRTAGRSGCSCSTGGPGTNGSTRPGITRIKTRWTGCAWRCACRPCPAWGSRAPGSRRAPPGRTARERVPW